MLYNLVHNHFKPKLPSENNVPMYLITLSESNKKKPYAQRDSKNCSHDVIKFKLFQNNKKGMV